MQSLRVFSDVARHRSFSLAATANGITQSAVSQRVSSLEKKLGVVLVDRSCRPLALTGAGRAYLQGCRDLLARYEKLEAAVSKLNELEGKVHVTAIYSAGIDLLHHVKETFEATHRRVKVVVDYKRPEAVYDQVRQGRCDLGILSYPQRWADVATINLRDEVMAVVCRTTHALTQQPRVDAHQLINWPLVSFDKQLPLGRHIRRYLREQGVNTGVSYAFDNIDTVKNALTMTDSVSILPTRTVLRDVAAGHLAVVPLTPRLVRPMGIIHAKAGGNRTPGRGQEFSQAVQAFIDFLLEHAGPNADVVDEIDAKGRQLVGDNV